MANGGQVQAYAMSNGAFLRGYTVGPSPDGTGVTIGGTFNGDVIVNDNNGTVGLLDPVTSIYTTIASGGTRGDFVSPDTSNGTLFLSEVIAVYRLGCGPGYITILAVEKLDLGSQASQHTVCIHLMPHHNF